MIYLFDFSGIWEFFKSFPELLKSGVIGLGAILAALAFLLLLAEHMKKAPRENVLKSIYIFMAFDLFLILAGVYAKYLDYPVPQNLVPSIPKILVDSLPTKNSDKYSIVKDISIFDLRAWKPVPVGKEDEKISPVSFFNYLHVKKISAIDSITAHYATSGADIDLRCISHNAKIYRQKSISHDGAKEFGVQIDVSDHKIGEEFLILIEATYWNGFKNIDRESASTYTDEDVKQMQELSLIVLLPDGKGVKSLPDRKVFAKAVSYDYIRRDKFFIDKKSHRFIYWNIIDFKPNEHYQLEWDW